MLKTYTVVTVKSEDGNLIATVPQLPGVVAQGGNTEEIVSRIKDATCLYIKTLEQEKLHIPQSFELVSVNEVEIEI